MSPISRCITKRFDKFKLRRVISQVRDLLGKNQRAKLEVKERPDYGVYVRDLSTVMVHSPIEMEKLMSLGNKNRKVIPCRADADQFNNLVCFVNTGSTAATNMNEHSSRSHAIFSITVERCEMLQDGKKLLRQGKLHLVDLAVNW